ncbi:unannotated protein [freshwater metagenome]|uniref:Unannotated protein n=1 Tax=freshwater metagenome TaxID=449393 RepID=A0A6J7JJY8_9ZZZZ|nr:NAD(P)H-binding protein [Actinomycetota bacterium]
MTSQIVLFGATGFTGDLTARELVSRGVRPVLAGRDAHRLALLAQELGGLETRTADVADPESVAALVGAGDVLISTVGPFARWGAPAVEAAIGAGAHYLDSTGEGTFIRQIFEEYGPRAAQAGVGLLTAMGYDWVPGNLAGALALRDAGPDAVRVVVGYFTTGPASADAMSGGTRASAAGMMGEPSYTFRDGALITERGARRVASFETAPGRRASAMSVGASEQFTLPRLHATLEEVDTYLGWFGPATRAVQAFSAVTAAVTRIGPVRDGMKAALAKVPGSTGGPDAEARAATGSVVVAHAQDAAGRTLASVRLTGPNAYDLTAGFLAWGAERAAAGGLSGTGALGPAEAFGLDEFERGAARCGLIRSAA